jgi:hypothetical protein
MTYEPFCGQLQDSQHHCWRTLPKEQNAANGKYRHVSAVTTVQGQEEKEEPGEESVGSPPLPHLQVNN